jgi:hypothetical protein
MRHGAVSPATPGGRRTLWITTKGFRSLILLFWIYPGATAMNSRRRISHLLPCEQPIAVGPACLALRRRSSNLFFAVRAAGCGPVAAQCPAAACPQLVKADTASAAQPLVTHRNLPWPGRRSALTKPEIAIEEIDRVIASGARFGCVPRTSSERDNKKLSNSAQRALDRDRDTVEACRLVLGMRCRPGYKNLYLVERSRHRSSVSFR